MMMRGDLQAMDRLLELSGEFDRYNGFGRAHLAAPAEAAPPRLVPPPRALLQASSAADGGRGKFSSQEGQKPWRSRALGERCLLGARVE